jgi:hypothetical protein
LDNREGKYHDKAATKATRNAPRSDLAQWGQITMSPVAELIAMQARLAKHNAEVEKRWEKQSADIGDVPYSSLEHDQRYLKIDGREG